LIRKETEGNSEFLDKIHTVLSENSQINGKGIIGINKFTGILYEKMVGL